MTSWIPRQQVIRLLEHKQLAFMVLRALLNEIFAGWGQGPERAKKKKKRRGRAENPRRAFCQGVGRMLRDELEFEGLFPAKEYVLAAGRQAKGRDPAQATRAKYKALGKFRSIDWTNAECARAGDWLVSGTESCSCFDRDERGLPKIADDHKAAIDALVEELVFRHPLYMPSLAEPPPWISWRTEYDDRINATFVKSNGDPETIKTITDAFADGSIEQHARAVSAVQRVPLKINPVMLPLLKEFGGEKYRRDIAVAEALLGKNSGI
jgi:hypothetical protein